MTLLSVPDMSCGHCKASVTSALSALPGIAHVEVDLQTRQVEVGGTVADPDLLKALDEIGFPAEVLPAK